MSVRRYILSITALLIACSPMFARKKKHDVPDQTVQVETTITAVSSAELSIDDKRVEGSTSWWTNYFSFMDLEQRKANLIADLCREIGADILVDPQFTYSRRWFGGGRLTVSGYPAHYTGFRTMTEMEVDSFIKTPVYQTGKVVFINK